MISLALAQRLKEAGLVWMAQNHDFFAVPVSGLDEQVFVLSDTMAYLDLLRGWPVVAFAGATEWALDHIWTHEVVWLPTETQLRKQIGQRVAECTLQQTAITITCTLDNRHHFTGSSASEAYGLALLHLLEQEQ